MCVYIYIYIYVCVPRLTQCLRTLPPSQSEQGARPAEGGRAYSEERFYTPPPPPRGGGVYKIVVSILAQSKSLKLLPGGGGV